MKKGLKGLLFGCMGLLAVAGLAACDNEQKQDPVEKPEPACAHENVDTAWLRDTANHWHECKDCGEMVSTAIHTYSEWTITTPVDEEKGTDGLKERTCSVCGFKQKQVIAAPKLTAPAYYLRGDMNGWLNSPTEAQLSEFAFEINENVATLNYVYIEEGKGFKIAEQPTWNNDTTIDFSKLDPEKTADWFESDNGNIKCKQTGWYNFKVTVDRETTTLEVTQFTGYYLKGGMNSWSTNEDYKFTINVETKVATLEGVQISEDTEFKLADDSWSFELNASNLDDTAKQWFEGTDNIKCKVTGTYDFKITLGATVKLEITKK